MATAYTNPCGSGDRRALVIVSTGTSISLGSGLAGFVDGNRTANSWFFSTSTGNSVEFWFPSKKIIDEATWYQQNTASHGTWQWQGGNDRTTWTDIGSTFTLGGVATQTQTTLAGNTTAYVFYRLVQVSGNTSSSPWLYEIEFKIDEGGTTSYLNPLGSGTRTATIATTSSGITWTGSVGTPAALVNGTNLTDLKWTAATNAGTWVQFDFGGGVVVQQARFWFDMVSVQGDWKLQGSPDASTWTDISATVTLGQTPIFVSPFLTCFGGGESNTTAYRYYRLLGVSGTRDAAPKLYEVEFMVAAAVVAAAVATAQPYVWGPL